MFLFRALWRFVFAFLWIPALAVAAVLVLAYALFAAVDALVFIWAAICGFFWLFSGRTDLGHAALWCLLIGTCGFGVMMAIQGMVWDAWKRVMGPNTWVEDEPFAGADDEKKGDARATTPTWTEQAAAYQLIPRNYR